MKELHTWDVAKRGGRGRRGWEIWKGLQRSTCVLLLGGGCGRRLRMFPLCGALLPIVGLLFPLGFRFLLLTLLQAPHQDAGLVFCHRLIGCIGNIDISGRFKGLLHRRCLSEAPPGGKGGGWRIIFKICRHPPPPPSSPNHETCMVGS